MKKLDKYQSIQKTIDQLIRNYRIPVNSSKEDVLNTILLKVERNEKLKYSSQSGIKLLPFIGYAAAVAAIIVVVYLFTATVQYTGFENKTASVRLPDNSRVVMEGNSHLSLKKYFWNRKVKLDGAAYFEVEKGSTFRVNTEMGKVEVLGTRFFVSEEHETMTVQCFEGKVKTDFGDNSYLLTAGKQIENVEIFKKSEIHSIEISYPEVAIFKGNYRSVSLKEIIDDMDSFFGVKIEMNVKPDMKFSGAIETGKIENALEIVCTSLQLEYKFTDSNTIQIKKL